MCWKAKENQSGWCQVWKELSQYIFNDRHNKDDTLLHKRDKQTSLVISQDDHVCQKNRGLRSLQDLKRKNFSCGEVCHLPAEAQRGEREPHRPERPKGSGIQ